MGFYDLSKEERKLLVQQIDAEIENSLLRNEFQLLEVYFSDEDTYIRKAAYQAIFKAYKKRLKNQQIIEMLNKLFASEEAKIRQTVVNAAGEIGKLDFGIVQYFFDRALFDKHHSVRNAVIGSMKKMAEKNPIPVLEWSKPYLLHEEKEIRREICHGLELRGRTHPQEVLPLLELLQHDATARVRNTLIHVLGQISYKKGCLEKVVLALKKWENKQLVREAYDEIVDVHRRYAKFANCSQEEVISYIANHS